MNKFVSIAMGVSALAAVACSPVKEDGNKIYCLKNQSGMEVNITNFGGRITSVLITDKNGVRRDVVLGFDNVEDYYPENHQSDFGAAIGRYANRINQGKFSIDGVEYDLPKNNFGHCLHGGPTGWQYQPYKVVEVSENHIKLEMDSPDGDNNFPGAVTAFVTYTLTDNNAIDILYEATTTAPTVINMTNHSYFNLSGDPTHDICDEYLYVNASNYTPIDSTCMTSGEILPVAGTPMDFTTLHKIGDKINDTDFEQIVNGNGYDHNWVLDTDGDMSKLAAKLYCEQTGIMLDVYTNEPGIQVYTGNFLDGTVTGKGGITYNKRAAICLETQHYPDTPNKPQWPSAVLRPGEKYVSRCTFAFSVVK